MLYDPSVGSAATLTLFNRRALTELSMQMADAFAEQGDDAMSDNFWLMGVKVDG